MPHAQASGFPPRLSRNKRSAGACPPRALLRKKTPRGTYRGGLAPANVAWRAVRDLAIPNYRGGGLSSAIVAWRGTGPRPTVLGAVFFTVVRGLVPRDVSITVVRGPVPRDRFPTPL